METLTKTHSLFQSNLMAIVGLSLHDHLPFSMLRLCLAWALAGLRYVVSLFEFTCSPAMLCLENTISLTPSTSITLPQSQGCLHGLLTHKGTCAQRSTVLSGHCAIANNFIIELFLQVAYNGTMDDSLRRNVYGMFEVLHCPSHHSACQSPWSQCHNAQELNETQMNIR